MLQVEKILFPTDLSNGVERAWRVATFFAKICDAEIVVAHVDTAHGTLEQVVSEEDDSIVDRLQELAQTTVPVRGLRVRASEVGEGILRTAEEVNADLLNMATHGHGGVRRLLIGSITEEVVRTAPCPVLTVRLRKSDVAQFSGVESILVPVDFSQHSRMSLMHAVYIAKLCNARLDLLHIIEQRAMPRVYDRGAASLSIKAAKERSVEVIESLVYEELQFDRAAVHVETGYASEDIIQWANEHDNDLVVISSHGRSNIERMLLGSVTQRVVRLAQCPVLTLKSFGKSLLKEPPPHVEWPVEE